MSSDENNSNMNATQLMLMTAPVVVGCVRSFGTLR